MEQRSEINVQDFKRRKVRQWIVAVPLVFVMFFFFWLKENPEASIGGFSSATLAKLGLGLIFSALIFSYWNWRCPSCDKYLGKVINPKFCLHCGSQLG